MDKEVLAMINEIAKSKGIRELSMEEMDRISGGAGSTGYTKEQIRDMLFQCYQMLGTPSALRTGNSLLPSSAWNVDGNGKGFDVVESALDTAWAESQKP